MGQPKLLVTQFDVAHNESFFDAVPHPGDVFLRAVEGGVVQPDDVVSRAVTLFLLVIKFLESGKASFDAALLPFCKDRGVDVRSTVLVAVIREAIGFPVIKIAPDAVGKSHRHRVHAVDKVLFALALEVKDVVAQQRVIDRFGRRGVHHQHTWLLSKRLRR